MKQPLGSLRIGSWPGPSAAQNSFVKIMCSALETAGCHIVEIDDVARVAPSSIDILHMHWPEEVFWRGGRLRQLARIAEVVASLRRLHYANVRIVWMVHNLKPHDVGRWQLAIWALYVRAMRPFVDAYVTLSAATEPLVAKAIGIPRHALLTSIHLPLYPRGPSMHDARARLAISAEMRVFTFFGLIRPYKGIDELLSVFKSLSDTKTRLIIAGKPQTSAIQTALEAAAADPRIVLRLGYLDEDELSDVIAAADWIVLPFVDYLHSSTIIRALSQEKPVITPATPFAAQVRADSGEANVHLYERPLRLGDLRVAGASAPTARAALAAYEPAAVGQHLAEIYRSLQVRSERIGTPASRAP